MTCPGIANNACGSFSNDKHLPSYPALLKHTFWAVIYVWELFLTTRSLCSAASFGLQPPPDRLSLLQRERLRRVVREGRAVARRQHRHHRLSIWSLSNRPCSLICLSSRYAATSFSFRCSSSFPDRLSSRTRSGWLSNIHSMWALRQLFNCMGCETIKYVISESEWFIADEEKS